MESYALEATNLEVVPAGVPVPRVRRRLDLTEGDIGWLVLIFDDVFGLSTLAPLETGGS